MNKIIVALFSILLLSNCTQVIDIDLNNSDPKIIVEGSITNEAGTYFVKLSKSVNFDQSNSYPPISNAVVTISDETIIDTLIEIKSGVYQTQRIQGVIGKTYKLNINVNGEVITASSTMPDLVPLDSITFLISEFGRGNNEKIYVPIPHFKDPISSGNSYRFKMTVNDTLDKTFFVDNDDLINGLEYQRPLFSNDRELKLGSTLLVEMQCIDRAIFDYFTSLNSSIGNGPGGGATPSNPTSNINGNAIGYFSAHTAQRKLVIVK